MPQKVKQCGLWSDRVRHILRFLNIAVVSEMKSISNAKTTTPVGTFFDRILDAFFFFAGILLAFATISVALAVCSRYFFSRPWGWVPEVCEYILLYITFLISAWVLKHDEHVRMDILINLLPATAQAVVNAITSVISALVCLIIAIFAARVTWGLYQSKAFTYTILELPKFIFTAVIVVGTVLLFIQFLIKAFGHVNSLKSTNSK